MAEDALHVSDRVAEELSYVVEMPSAKLSELSAVLEKTSSIVSRRELLKIFRDVLGPSKLSSRVVTNLASLNLLRDDPEKTPDSILTSLVSGCKNSGNEELAEKLSAKRSEIKKLINSEALYFSIKASQLFTLDTQHLHELKVICDARPIFNPKRDDFPVTILYSTLHITASDASEKERRFSIALRAHELDEIIEECERAKQKMESLQKELSKLHGKVIVQYGEAEK